MVQQGQGTAPDQGYQIHFRVHAFCWKGLVRKRERMQDACQAVSSCTGIPALGYE